MSDKLTVSAVKRFRAKPCKHLQNTFHVGNIPCEKCRVENMEKDLRSTKAMIAILEERQREYLEENSRLRKKIKELK